MDTRATNLVLIHLREDRNRLLENATAYVKAAETEAELDDALALVATIYELARVIPTIEKAQQRIQAYAPERTW